MKRVSFCVLAVMLAGAGCGGSLTAPDTVQAPPATSAESATVTGRIYANLGSSTPPIANALIEVNAADGSGITAASDADGFYKVSVPVGSITITVSNDGYEAKQWQFDLLKDTVLNFGLSPIGQP